MLITPSFKIENQYNGIVAGIDEAGRGPLCGPVITGCVILDQKKYPLGLNDSKKLSEKERERLFGEILELEKQGFIKYGIGGASHSEIDFFNIRNATGIAMRRAYQNLSQKYQIKPSVVLVDGNFIPDIDTRAKFIIKGDAKSFSISAASIVAKVTRDRIMYQLAKKYPIYKWHKNKGYGTREHLDCIKKHGITKYHRKSFVHIQEELF